MKTIHGEWRNSDEAVTLVDAHHHIWDIDNNYYPWLGDVPEEHFFLGDYTPLKRNYMPEDYRRDAKDHNVFMTVHCEAEWDRSDLLAAHSSAVLQLRKGLKPVFRSGEVPRRSQSAAAVSRGTT